MQTPVMARRATSPLWRVVDGIVIIAAILVVLIVLRHAFVIMPWSISGAFALDNPLPDLALAFERFERIAAMGVSASLFLLGYALIRKMMAPRVSMTPFMVLSTTMMALVFSSVVTWRVSPALSWTRPDAAEVSKQLWSAYAWSSSQSEDLPSWADSGSSQQWRLPGGLVVHVETRGKMTRVSLPVSSGLSCQYLLDELSSQSLPEGAELRLDRQRIDARGYGNACEGDKMKEVLLVSETWPEQS